ncbi:MAG: hypothetical protein Q4E51_05425 [Lachnospiraceae bacterium]|nr:hypothetical protein [Lachnospiraceae bacterium]
MRRKPGTPIPQKITLLLSDENYSFLNENVEGHYAEFVNNCINVIRFLKDDNKINKAVVKSLKTELKCFIDSTSDATSDIIDLQALKYFSEIGLFLDNL